MTRWLDVDFVLNNTGYNCYTAAYCHILFDRCPERFASLRCIGLDETRNDMPCGRLPIRDNWTFFAISYGSDVISSRRFSKGGFVNLSANFRWNGASPIKLCWYQKTRVITLSCGIKISAVCSSFRHKARVRRTDARTVGHTNPQDRTVKSEWDWSHPTPIPPVGSDPCVK